MLYCWEINQCHDPKSTFRFVDTTVHFAHLVFLGHTLLYSLKKAQPSRKHPLIGRYRRARRVEEKEEVDEDEQMKEEEKKKKKQDE